MSNFFLFRTSWILGKYLWGSLPFEEESHLHSPHQIQIYPIPALMERERERGGQGDEKGPRREHLAAKGTVSHTDGFSGGEPLGQQRHLAAAWGRMEAGKGRGAGEEDASSVLVSMEYHVK
jgi:hypothetical protein